MTENIDVLILSICNTQREKKRSTILHSLISRHVPQDAVTLEALLFMVMSISYL